MHNMITQLEKSIEEFNIDLKTKQLLIENKINSIKDLWNLKRQDLKKLGLNDQQINQISIQMQLIGIDLNKKVYK